MRQRVILNCVTVLGAVFFSFATAAGPAIDASKAKADKDGVTLWHDIRLLGVEGQGWSDVKAPFDRLPAKSEKVVRRAVWSLSRHSAGMAVRFVTDATTIHARWTLTSANLAMSHMAATGVSGLDLYVKSEDGQWRWLNVGRPTAQTNTQKMASGIPPGKREYLLYLPLYNGVSSVEIGIPKTSSLEKAPAYPAARSKPIVFYGTSITHGACASRPGMPHPSILGRRFQRPVINLGFSGNGKMDPELGILFGELDPAVYVLDCLPNMNAKEVAERAEPFVRALRKARPDTPILMVEDRTYSDAFLVKSKRDRNLTSRVEFLKAFEQLKKAGVKNLHYLKGDHLLGDDNEGTVDSSHPNDLGFMRQADAFAESLAPLLK
ncbi:MAG: hypothetical protein ACI9VS_003199 [Candidatus Binatia bacterium]|jgi:hypothetical protein